MPGNRFPPTRWTMVNAAGHQSNPRAETALAELCQIYWPPLYAYLRGRGYDVEQAQDLTQGFFASFLERQSISAADPTRGRFRSFLLTALNRYVINEYHRELTVQRGGRHVHLALDFESAEREYAIERGNDETPDRVFDRKWASIALDRALRRLREECNQDGKSTQTDALLPYLTEIDGLPSYKAVGAELGLTEGAVKVAVHRLRQRFGAVLRLEVAETVTADHVEDEVRELLRAVSF